MGNKHLAIVRAFEHVSQRLDLAPTHVCLDVPRTTVLSPRALREAAAQKGRAPGSALPRVRKTKKGLSGKDARGDSRWHDRVLTETTPSAEYVTFHRSKTLTLPRMPLCRT